MPPSPWRPRRRSAVTGARQRTTRVSGGSRSSHRACTSWWSRWRGASRRIGKKASASAQGPRSSGRSVLKLASLAQSVTVTAGSSVESRSSGIETRFGPEHLATIPTRRFSMFDAIRSTPGMSPTSPSSGTVNSVSSFGSGVNENAFLIDGTTFTCPCSGVSRAEPSVDVIQEVHVQSIGASVEFGNIQGAVINVVTKQGGARFQLQSGYYGQASGLTAQPIVLPVTNGTQPSSGYERVRYRDFSAGLGGPVLRDRLWFYGAYQYLRDYDSQPGADPAFPRKYEQNKVFGKLTWRLTPALQMMQSFHEEFWENPDPPTLATPFEATLRRHASVPSSTFADVTYAPSRSARCGICASGGTSSTSRTTRAPGTGPRRTGSIASPGFRAATSGKWAG